MIRLKNRLVAISMVLILITSMTITGEVVTFAESDTENAEVVDIETKNVNYNQSNLSGNVIADHELLTENDNYQVFLRDDTLSIIVRDKKTGNIMESTVTVTEDSGNSYWQNFMQSGIVLEVIENVTTIYKRVGLNEAVIDLNKKADGFSAYVNYEKYGFSYNIDFVLNDNGFTITIPDESIKEENDVYKIANIYVYPFMGYTELGERDGYMLIPDGNGAIINLDDKEGRYSSGFSKKVYGDNVGIKESYVLSLFWDKYQTVNDDELILAPVFGMVHEDSQMAYLGIIEDGMFDATIEAYPNGAYTNFNWISSKFRLRQVYVQPTSKSGGSTTKVEDDRTHSDIRVSYNFSTGDEANYVGLAEIYRNYLLGNEKIVKKETDFKIRLDFFGADIKKWFLFDIVVPMTTVSQMQEIIDDLNENGVDDIVAIYKGWQKGGINTLPITKYEVESKLGSEKSLAELIEYGKDNSVDIYLYQDALRANPKTSNTTYDVIKKIDKRLYEEDTYKDVFEKMVFVTAQKTYDNITKTMKSYSKYDINNVALTGITKNLFGYTYRGDTYSRVDTAQTYDSAVSELDENVNLILDEPFEYLWKYADGLYNIPVGSSKYIYTDADVPFLSIALKGIVPMYSDYINFEADKNEYFLSLVETGIMPSFYLTYEDTSKLLYTNSNDIYSAKYSVYEKEIVNYYKELKEINVKTYGAYIIGHDTPQENVVIVTYDNGVKIYVNYNETAVDINDVIIDALSYKVGEKIE